MYSSLYNINWRGSPFSIFVWCSSYLMLISLPCLHFLPLWLFFRLFHSLCLETKKALGPYTVIALPFPQVCVGWGNKHRIHSVDYWNDFLVPTLFKCQMDLCSAVVSYILGFCVFLFTLCTTWPLLGLLIWPSVISIYLLHLRVIFSILILYSQKWKAVFEKYFNSFSALVS